MQWKQEYINTVKTLAKQGLSSSKIGEAMFEQYNINFSGRTIRRYAQGVEKDTTNVRGVELTINQDGSQTSITRIQMTSEQAKDPDFVLRAHGFDSAKWDIISLKNNFWQMGSKDSDPVDLYQSKITVKPISGFSMNDIIDQLKTDVKKVSIKINKDDDKHNLVLPLADIHFGITKIADFEEHLHKIIPILKRGYNTVVIEQLGDLFHSSQMWNTQTMRGIVLDDVNMVQAVEDAKTLFDLLIVSIKAKQIIIKQMAGNHSGNMEYMFMEYLKAKYPQMIVENNIKYREAYLLGRVGILMAHGDFARKGLPMLFANEFGDVWGNSNQRYIHTGHYHTQKTTDEGGAIWEQFGTIKPNDKYEISNGWTMSKKTMYLIEYSDSELFAEYYV